MKRPFVIIKLLTFITGLLTFFAVIIYCLAKFPLLSLVIFSLIATFFYYLKPPKIKPRNTYKKVNK